MEEKLFSEMGQGKPYVRPEKMLVIKRTGVKYDNYWSEDKRKFGPLLEATVYNDEPTEIMRNGEVVDYRVITGIKN